MSRIAGEAERLDLKKACAYWKAGLIDPVSAIQAGANR